MLLGKWFLMFYKMLVHSPSWSSLTLKMKTHQIFEDSVLWLLCSTTCFNVTFKLQKVLHVILERHVNESGGKVMLVFCMMSVIIMLCVHIVTNIQRSKAVTSCTLISPTCILPVKVKHKNN